MKTKTIERGSWLRAGINPVLRIAKQNFLPCFERCLKIFAAF